MRLQLQQVRGMQQPSRVFITTAFRHYVPLSIPVRLYIWPLVVHLLDQTVPIMAREWIKCRSLRRFFDTGTTRIRLRRQQRAF